MRGMWLVMAGLLVALSGCMTVEAQGPPRGVGFAPEDAVLAWAQAGPSAVVNSIAIRQVAPLDAQRAVVLASFRPEGWRYAQPALALFLVESEGSAWRSGEPHFAPVPVLHGDVLTLDSARIGDLHAAFGLLVDERASQVQITRADGSEERVARVNGSYLSLHPAPPTRAAALDAADQVVGVTRDE